MSKEILESEIELFVQRILMHEFYTSGSEYHIIKVSPGSEKTLGYDAKIDCLTPFYCQFKTSSYLSSGKRFKMREKFCADKNWPIRPAYAFGLRPPSDKTLSNKPDAWQHNILHSLWKYSSHAVAYVAPTFHTRLGMQAFEPRPVHHCCLCATSHNSHRSHIDINEVFINGNEYARLPAFHGLISIPPHVHVNSLSHKYFYTSHKDVTFHSEVSEVNDSMPFGDYLIKNVLRTLDADRQKIVQERITVDSVATMTGLDQYDVIRVLKYGSSLLEKKSVKPGDFNNLKLLNQQLALAYPARLHNSYHGGSTPGIRDFTSISE